MQQVLNGFIGVFALIVILCLLSENRKKINWRTIGMALLLQLSFAFLVIKIQWVRSGFEHVSGFFVTLLSFTQADLLFCSALW